MKSWLVSCLLLRSSLLLSNNALMVYGFSGLWWDAESPPEERRHQILNCFATAADDDNDEPTDDSPDPVFENVGSIDLQADDETLEHNFALSAESTVLLSATVSEQDTDTSTGWTVGVYSIIAPAGPNVAAGSYEIWVNLNDTMRDNNDLALNTVQGTMCRADSVVDSGRTVAACTFAAMPGDVLAVYAWIESNVTGYDSVFFIQEEEETSS